MKRDRGAPNARAATSGIDPPAILAAIAAHTPNPIFAIDADARLSFANASAVQLFGAPPSGLIGLPVSQWVDLGAALRHAISGKSGTELLQFRGAGGAQTFLTLVSPIQDSAGQVVGALCNATAVDQSSRPAASQNPGPGYIEARLIESEQRFKLLAENLDDVFWIVDWKTRRQLYVSPSYSRCWGFDEQEVMNGMARWPDKVHPDDRSAVASRFEALANAEPGNDQFAVEYRLLLDNGEQRWIRDRGMAVRSSNGEIERVIGIAEDITDRRSVVRSLQEREQRLQRVLEASQLHVWTLHTLTRKLSMAELLCVSFGLTPEDCKRLGPWRRRLHPKDRVRVERALRLLVETGTPMQEEFRVQRADGNITWLHVRAVLIRDDFGDGAEVQGLAADVTPRKQQEQSLRTNGERLRLALDAGRLSAWSIEAGTNLVAADPGLYALFGKDESRQYELEEWLAGAHPEDRGRLSEEMAAALAVPGEYEFEFRLRRDDGELRWVDAQLIVLDEHDGTNAAYGVARDVTLRRRLDQQLRNSESELRTITSMVPIGIVRVSRDRHFQFVNEAYAKSFLNSAPQDLVGRSLDDVLGPDIMAELGQHIDDVMSGNMTDFEAVVRLPAGLRHIHSVCTPEYGEDGQVTGFIGAVEDISERAQAQNEREALLASEHQARKQAEAAARGRDEFLAIVSHELRSPLNGIQSWTHVLESTTRDPGKVMLRALNGIRTGVDQQVRLIEDLLDATRIMSGKLSLNMAPLKLLPVLISAVESVRAKAVEKSIDLALDCSITDETVMGDADRLQQVVWNLLSNAVKFTPSGGHVRLNVAREVENQTLVFRIDDDGRGIDAAFLPHLFERFRRDETGNSRGHDGLGLGLMLVRHLCQLHGGDVTATSAGTGKGASFTVRLPLHSMGSPHKQMALDQGAVGTLPSLSDCRVLLVDDHLESRDALAVLLVQAGASVEVLASGDEAVQRIMSAEPSAKPDVLVCDIAMPGKDGYQTVVDIRAHERRSGSARLPAIALTALTQNDDRVRAMNAGFDLHRSKPVAVDDLIITIAAVARSAHA